jgi:CelD/BcsL family acetyltransferase involved in cellulose biosynthesis
LSFGRAWIRYVPRQYDRHYADLSTTYDAYLGTFSTKSRSNLRKKVRKFEERSRGPTRWRCYKTSGEIEEFYRFARDISRQSYQERLLDAGLPEDEAFRAAMVERAKEGRVRGYLIFLDEIPIAYLYCPIHEGIVSYAFLGYRAEFSELSPGTVLLWLVMEELFREGTHRIFDFTEGGDRGQHSQKRLFSTGSVQCADVYLFRRTAANWIIVLTHLAVDWLSASIGFALESLGLKRRVKSWTRSIFRVESRSGA